MPDDIFVVPEEIQAAATSGHLVVFVGAGLSRLVGAPSWGEFATGCLKYLYDKKLINLYDMEKLQSFEARRLLTLCDSIQRENPGVPPPDFPALIRGKADKKARFQVFEDLYAFKAIYITTNYDTFLDNIAEAPATVPTPVAPGDSGENAQTQLKQKSFFHGKDFLESKLEPGNILHIHGSVEDRESMIITIRDYLKHYDIGSDIQEFLARVFGGQYTVLFIGYGLEELEILEALVRRMPVVKDELRHFMLYRHFEEESRLLDHHKRYYKELGVKLLPYSISGRGNEILAEIVSKWAEQLRPIARPMDYLEQRKLIDAGI